MAQAPAVGTSCSSGESCSSFHDLTARGERPTAFSHACEPRRNGDKTGQAYDARTGIGFGLWLSPLSVAMDGHVVYGRRPRSVNDREAHVRTWTRAGRVKKTLLPGGGGGQSSSAATHPLSHPHPRSLTLSHSLTLSRSLVVKPQAFKVTHHQTPVRIPIPLSINDTRT